MADADGREPRSTGGLRPNAAGCAGTEVGRQPSGQRRQPARARSPIADAWQRRRPSRVRHGVVGPRGRLAPVLGRGSLATIPRCRGRRPVVALATSGRPRPAARDGGRPHPSTQRLGPRPPGPSRSAAAVTSVAAALPPWRAVPHAAGHTGCGRARVARSGQRHARAGGPLGGAVTPSRSDQSSGLSSAKCATTSPSTPSTSTRPRVAGRLLGGVQEDAPGRPAAQARQPSWADAWPTGKPTVRVAATRASRSSTSRSQPASEVVARRSGRGRCRPTRKPVVDEHGVVDRRDRPGDDAAARPRRGRGSPGCGAGCCSGRRRARRSRRRRGPRAARRGRSSSSASSGVEARRPSTAATVRPAAALRRARRRGACARSRRGGSGSTRVSATDGHEVGVAVPAGQHVHVQVVRARRRRRPRPRFTPTLTPSGRYARLDGHAPRRVTRRPQLGVPRRRRGPRASATCAVRAAPSGGPSVYG